MDLKDIILEYHQEELSIQQLEKNPVDQLRKWMEQVKKAEITYPNAATLCTSNPNEYPQSRIVLLKEIQDEGVCFFTDYRSHKAENIANNPKVSLLLFWKELDRQIRICGTAKKLDIETSKNYFQSRPRDSQISAWTSHQSQMNTKEKLLENLAATKEKFKEQETLPLPDYWGGYIVSFDTIEFWQGRPNRLHDRFLYEREENNHWKISRLDP